MDDRCLDVDAIRAAVSRDSYEPSRPSASRGVTRRTFLFAGAAALTSTTIKGIPSGTADLSFRRSRGAFRFLLNGIEAWVIDPSRFAGKPRLEVRAATGDLIELRLIDARFPGTSLPANLSCRCERRRRRWTINLDLELGSFHATDDLLRWLDGKAALSSTVKLHERVEHSPLASFAAHINARQVEFRPDWSFHFINESVAEAIIGNSRVRSSDFTLKLGSETPTFLTRRARKSTSLSIDRGGHRWDLAAAVPRPPAGDLITAPDAFDRLDVVFEESAGGLVRVSAQAPARRADSSLMFHPGSNFVDPEDTSVVFPLRDALFAFGAHATSSESALAARFALDLPWLAVSDAVLQLAGSDDADFEIVAQNGALTSFRCTPRVVASLMPLGELVTQSTPMPCPTPVAIHHDPPASAIDWGKITACSGTGEIELFLPNCCVAVARPDDLLNVCFELRNLRVRKRLFHAPLLEPTGGGEPMVIAHFPPQSILERAFLEDASGSADCPTDPPVDSRLSGTSRVAFTIPACVFDNDGLPFTLASLLSWDRFEPSLVDEIRDLPKIKEPKSHQTAIEAPYRLVLSPERTSLWKHSDQPVKNGLRTELWHTRLTRTGEHAEEDPIPKVRAVWSPDFQPTGADPVPVECPFRASLNPRDRHRLVRLTHDLRTGPTPVDARLLALSSLGAWLDLHGFWDFTIARQAIPLEKWDHLATMGRDQHVVVENRGFLYPFGHKCVLVKETERKVQPARFDGGRPTSYVAYLRQRKYIRVKEPIRSYEPATFDFSFATIEFKDLISPTLDPIRGIRKDCAHTPAPPPRPPLKPGECQTADNDCDPSTWCESAFWPEVGGKAFRFRIQGIDRGGNAVDFDAPVVFIEDRIAETNDCLPKSCGDASECVPIPSSMFSPSLVLDDVGCEYKEDDVRRQSDFRGQTHALSKTLQKGDTEIESRRTLFFHEKSGIDRPPFRPIVEAIEGRVPALDTIAQNGGVAWFVLDDPDRSANSSQTFAHLAMTSKGIVTASADKLQAAFDEHSDRSGGIAAPRPRITQLSRSHGPIGDPPQPSLANDRSGIESFFHSDAKIFGVIELSKIIAALDFNLPDSIPAMLSTLVPSTDGPDEITQSIVWRTQEIQSFDFTPIFSFEKGDKNCELSIEGYFQLWLDPDLQPRFSMTGTLRDFRIALKFSGSGIVVNFDSVQFISGSERTTDVKVDIAGVDFIGALAFVQKLQEFLHLPAGVKIDLQPTAVVVSAPPLKVPTINLGVFSLQDLVITSSIRLPFRKEHVLLNFDFGSPQRPFLVNVGIFAGGGFFGVGVSSHGLDRLAAAFEFGAMKALNFGVADGRLYVMGGLFYSRELIGAGPESLAKYRAYVRAGGELHAFGCLSFGVDLYVALSAEDNGHESYLIGIATLTYSFEIAFVKKSFSITYQERFAGSASHSSQTARLRSRPQNVLVASFAADVLGGGCEACTAGTTEPTTPTLDSLMPEDAWITYWTAFAEARN